MKVLMFQPCFEDRVRDGRKTQTIRAERKRAPVAPGDKLSLRAWLGQAYRSKQRELLESVCESVTPILIFWDHLGWIITLNGMRLSDEECALLARADGFGSTAEMIQWFEGGSGLPFEGVVITWQ